MHLRSTRRNLFIFRRELARHLLDEDETIWTESLAQVPGRRIQRWRRAQDSGARDTLDDAEWPFAQKHAVAGGVSR